jgi:hypothetical protein
MCPEALPDVEGVGTPCASHDDCLGLDAELCPLADQVSDLDFCTRQCDVSRPDACAEGSTCVDQGNHFARCVPTLCAEQLREEPFYPTVPIPCWTDGPVNDLGVGLNCELNVDCDGVPAATCPLTLYPELPNWCSMLCERDSHCGEGAFCWIRPAIDLGGAVVGSCAPIECRTWPAPSPSCAVGSVNDHGVGRVCAEAADCADQAAATCPAAEQAGDPAFCTLDCATDVECGRHAFCQVLEVSEEFEFSGRCVPLECIP